MSLLRCPFGEVLGAVPQQPADLVERVVGVTAVAELFPLHAAPDLIHDGGAELHDMERVQHLDRVRERVAQRVGVAAERVEGGVLDPGPEGLVLSIEPAGVGGARSP
jgi:hypothetical protein